MHARRWADVGAWGRTAWAERRRARALATVNTAVVHHPHIRRRGALFSVVLNACFSTSAGYIWCGHDIQQC